MNTHKLLSTLGEINRKTSLIQFVLILVGVMLFKFSNVFSTLLLEFLWRFYRSSDIDCFSFKYSLAILVIPFILVKIFFIVIGIIKFFIDKLWA